MSSLPPYYVLVSFDPEYLLMLESRSSCLSRFLNNKTILLYSNFGDGEAGTKFGGGPKGGGVGLAVAESTALGMLLTGVLLIM